MEAKERKDKVLKIIIKHFIIQWRAFTSHVNGYVIIICTLLTTIKTKFNLSTALSQSKYTASDNNYSKIIS